ncbi:UxaA family hydrolase [Aquimarina algicola]|uniref:Altronate dehydratase n=1 Tax=Aquimarina algicola TaxID=2589995 RepID=A0A504IRV4_9FLAO|nr:altronate dehydratase family protein [Aquimarina algicola]TPN81197.1 altronate dehydratase [Aquimarina algicola]
MNQKFLKIHPNDNVFVALNDIDKGENVAINEHSIAIIQNIPAKHKFAEKNIAPNDSIIMYGSLVGTAKHRILQGELLTTHNVIHETNSYSKKENSSYWSPPSIDQYSTKTFLGYHRNDGQVGTANYWMVIPLVFCENRNIEIMKQAFQEELGFAKPNKYKDLVHRMINLYKKDDITKIEDLITEENDVNSSQIFNNIDGIKFLTHQGGCGGTRQDSDMLCALIAGYLNNPNVAGATILSLGCQNAQISILNEKIRALNPNFDKPLYILEQQQEGTEEKLLSTAIKKTFFGLIKANKITRKPASLSKLVIGLECGGSDGFSGISANPTVGQVSDMIVALGGKTMLAEFPELCGVEQELINRSVNKEVSEKFINLMRDYANSAKAVGSGFDMNPSPGNIKDGLITDAMKSAGAAKKGGTSPVVAVLDYTEYATKQGLNLLCTPGNDVESTTALSGSGANIILFTTGLGTPTGNPITPVIKISSNTSLSNRMSDIIDFDTGAIIEGKKNIEQMSKELLEYIINVASGKIKTKSQLLHQDDFIPWKRGVSL